MNGLIKSVFFGNYFYGICAIALSIEASLQQQTALNAPVYYLFVFAGTVLYYTHAYIADTASGAANKRTIWYRRNKTLIFVSQLLLTIVFLITAIQLCRTVGAGFLRINVLQWFCIGIFPLIAILYYGSVTPNTASNNLRNKGWLKPFIIGFVWAGAVTIYPVLFSSIVNNTPYTPGLITIALFIKNLMFITVLCIMFDIKDYAADHNHQLKTFVVTWGLRKTIFYILIPLSTIGLGTFIVLAIVRDFPLLRILINTIPFILLIIVAYSLHLRKTILYYLAIIDGLMLIKAVCGIAGILLIK